MDELPKVPNGSRTPARERSVAIPRGTCIFSRVSLQILRLYMIFIVKRNSLLYSCGCLIDHVTFYLISVPMLTRAVTASVLRAQTHLKKTIDQKNAIIDAMAGQLDTLEDKLAEAVQAQRVAEAENAALRERCAQLEQKLSSSGLPPFPSATKPRRRSSNGAQLPELKALDVHALLASQEAVPSPTLEATLDFESSERRMTRRTRSRRGSNSDNEGDVYSLQPLGMPSGATEAQTAPMSHVPDTTPRLFEYCVVVSATPDQVTQLDAFIDSPPHVSIRIEPTVVATYPADCPDEIVADMCFPEGIGVEQLRDLRSDAGYFKQSMAVISGALGRRGGHSHTFILTGGMAGSELVQTRYAVCSMYKRPVVVGSSVFLIDTAVCVVSRFPFFEVLSFIVKGLCDVEQRWMRDSMDRVFPPSSPPTARPASVTRLSADIAATESPKGDKFNVKDTVRKARALFSKDMPRPDSPVTMMTSPLITTATVDTSASAAPTALLSVRVCGCVM
jgi:hypothetical protein